ncbi:MAG: hypothetical protein IJA04_05805 [Bacteroidaceae bacterium]|nr:hypothetical protein [Bacteroidaceae bacterium]
MKKYLIACLLTSCITLSFAQSRIDEDRARRYYCEVKGIEKELSAGLKIIFDFGDKASYNIWGDLSSKLKFVDESGEYIKFNSMIDAANYMVEKGWFFQQAYSSFYGDKSIIHWIFYKDASSFEEARKGILTKEEYKKLNN